MILAHLPRQYGCIKLVSQESAHCRVERCCAKLEKSCGKKFTFYHIHQLVRQLPLETSLWKDSVWLWFILISDVLSERVIEYHLYGPVILLFFIVRVNEVSYILILLSSSFLLITIAVFGRSLADWRKKLLHNHVVYGAHGLTELGYANLALWCETSQQIAAYSVH